MEPAGTMRSTYTTYDAVEYSGAATPRRLRPSARLKGRERALFIETVNDCAIGHFRKSDRPLLERYVEACALAEQAADELAEHGVVVDGKLSPWFPAHASACKTANNLALRLRLSPQSRSPRAPKTVAAPMSYYDTMELTPEEDSDDDDGDGADGGRH
jgi:phage terminase small subunit